MAALASLILAHPVRAQMTALSWVDPVESGVSEADGKVAFTLSLSQPVPWRVFTLDDPRRLVIDLSEVIWADDLGVASARIASVQTGAFEAGWSRMVAELTEPMVVATAGMTTGAEDGTAVLNVVLEPATEAEFAASARPLEMATATIAGATPVPDDGVMRVMLDPGHGGVDPGAEVGGLKEADLMLQFARELREVLLRAGGFEVFMTRDDDLFVPLETRITLARTAGADVLISLHADALPEDAGSASGATIYVLSDDASDLASQRLAERHDQSDLLAGVDLKGQGDEIALVLMELARRDTEPRVALLANTLVETISQVAGPMNGKPLRAAGFSVLKSPDIPSVLVEIGFLSSERDRKNLVDREWRLRMAQGIRNGLRAWGEADALRPRVFGQ